MSKKLLRSGFIVSFMTLISRVLGLVRDVVIANLMGAGSSADVFILANKIPNFLRRLFAEGAFSQAFVPVLAEYQETKPDETQQLIAKVSGTLGVIMTLVTLIGVLLSPVIIALFASGWFLDWHQGGANGDKYLLASDLLKLTFPYIFFITLTAFSGAVLNTMGKYSVAAFTPVLLNVAIISAAVLLAPNLAEPAYGLAIGVFFGGLVQLLFQLPFLYRAGALVKPSWGWSHPGVKKIRTLMIPALFGVSVSQINLLLDTIIASFLISGSISWLYYSDRLLEFPLGLFGIAIATVILPVLSRQHASADPGQFKQTMAWGIRCVAMLGLPAMMGLIMLAGPMLMVLFMRGAFTLDDVNMASVSLMAYGAGLLNFMMIKVLAPGFYARQDTKTPVKIGVIAMASNMVFNLILVFPFGYVGLALATSASAFLNMVLLYRGLSKANIYRFDSTTVWFIVKAALSAVLMAGVIYHLNPSIDTWQQFSFGVRVAELAKLIAIGALSYLISMFILGVRPRQLKTQ
ncbi:murein biosynthesis integral membrane protein MurJ [Paraferrimonas sp. SM1919]|uniref:murein biosynthesis integral membrane protein MurJ n=1 Tax=Paraferrimonas sp. SM1919 TaxID=2662263 RepID=UPI0013D42A7B|nr:murein biosynthesis integral membrane protein MurJ [Paraferrimonas sp. SM1919]